MSLTQVVIAKGAGRAGAKVWRAASRMCCGSARRETGDRARHARREARCRARTGGESRTAHGPRCHRHRTWQLSSPVQPRPASPWRLAGAVAAAGPWDSGQRTAERDWAAVPQPAGGADHGRAVRPGGGGARSPRPSAPSVLAGLGGASGAAAGRPPRSAALAAALDPLLDDPGLGTRRTAAVVDVADRRSSCTGRARTTR